MEKWKFKFFKTLLLSFCAALLTGSGVSMAADFYWVADTGCSNNWVNAGCWSSTSGGSGSAGTPGSGDRAIFDSNSPNASLVNASISAIEQLVIDGYTNTLSLNNNTIEIEGLSGFGLTYDPGVGGNITADTSTILFTTDEDDVSIDVLSSTLSLYNLEINKTGAGDKRVELATGNIIILNEMTLTSGQFTGCNIACEIVISDPATLSVASTFDGDGSYALANEPSFRFRNSTAITLPSDVNFDDTNIIIDDSDTLVQFGNEATSATISDLQITNNGGQFGNNNGIDIIINSDARIEGGTVNMPDGDFTVNDFPDSDGIAGMIIEGSGVFNGGASLGGSDTYTIDTLEVSSGGTFNGGTEAGQIVLEGVMTVTDSGSVFNAQGKSISSTLTSTTIISNSSGEINFGTGSVDIDGTFDLFNGTINCETASINTVRDFLMASAGTTNVDCSSAPSFTIGRDFDIEGSGGTFSAPALMTVEEDWDQTNGSTFTHNNGTVVFSGSAQSRYQDASTSGLPTTFYNLEIDKDPGVNFNLADGIDVDIENDFQITSGNVNFIFWCF